MPEHPEPEQCTCGATLVPDARFCHRCGRPTYEMLVPDEGDEPVIVAQVKAAPPPPVGFGNAVSLRLAFMLAMMIILAENIRGLQLFFPLWCFGAGWIGVRWYRRATGRSLTNREGGRLGSIVGVATAVALTVEFALGSKEIFEQAAAQDARLAPLLNDSMMRGSVFLVTVGFIFAAVVGLCAAGGALGGHLQARRSPPQ